MNKPKINLDLNLEIEVKQVNEVDVMHNPHDFVVTLSQIITTLGRDERGRQAIANITKRPIGRFAMSPAMAKNMLQVLQTNIKKYEEKYGEIVIFPPEGLS